MPPLPRTGTALHGYDRLEAPGLWRPGWSERRRDVVVSLGESTLTLTDRAERPVAHWSLPAVRRVGTDPPLYAPADADGTGDPEGETLEIEDAQMNEALTSILATLATDPAGGRLRLGAGLLAALALAALALWTGPGLMRSQAAAGLAPAQRAELGERLVAAMGDGAARPCSDPFGEAALRRLAAAVLGEPPPRIWVLPDGPEGGTATVPGGIVLSAEAIRAAGDPGGVAARLRAEGARGGNPVGALMEAATLGELARMLVAADPPPELIRRHAARLRATPAPEAAPAPESAPEGGTALLEDGDWIALRGICD